MKAYRIRGGRTAFLALATAVLACTPALAADNLSIDGLPTQVQGIAVSPWTAFNYVDSAAQTMLVQTNGPSWDIAVSRWNGTPDWSSPLPVYSTPAYDRVTASLSPDKNTLFYSLFDGGSNRTLIYQAPRLASGPVSTNTFGPGTVISSLINGPQYQHAPFFDGKTLYFDNGYSSVWKSDYNATSGAFGAPAPINSINLPGYSTSNAWVSRDHSLMLFSSDRPGGYGGRDIWSARWDANLKDWTNIQNLGSAVNTAKGEIAPRFAEVAHQLYFARADTADNRSIWHAPVVQASRLFTITPPPPDETARLREWDGAAWQIVNPGGLPSGNVHVLVHGAAPGQVDWLLANPRNGVWDNTEYFKDIAAAAAAIKGRDPRSHVLAFSWIDKSAVYDKGSLSDSRAWTDAMGGELAKELLATGLGIGQSKLQLIGHSHGARVVTEAAIALQSNNVRVAQLTLWDSPERAANVISAANSLDGELAKLLGGTSSARPLFVDNYYSQFGRSYSGVVNAALQGDHSWPVTWYGGATNANNGFALSWSPLLGFSPSILLSNYAQDAGDPYRLVPVTDTVPRDQTRTDLLATSTITTDVHVALASGGRVFTESSPAYWDAIFMKDPLNQSLEFQYRFINVGDGDALGIWIDDQLRFIMTGLLAGTKPHDGSIDISDLTSGEHLLTVALHSYGDANAQFFVSDFSVVSQIPEPASIAVLIAGAASLLVRRRRTASASVP